MEEFGWKNSPYFGYQYTIGVVTQNGIKAEQKITTPWIDDKNYRSIKSDSLKPGLTKTYVKRVTSAAYREYSKPGIDTAGKKAFITYKISDSLATVGETAAVSDTIGWLDAVTIKKTETLNDASHLSTIISRVQLSYNNHSKTAYLKNFDSKENVLGGVFFTCVINGGRIEFKAAGILKRDNTGWYIEFFSDTNTGNEPKNNQLTPLNNQPVTEKPKPAPVKN
jgi:hypothetical protein